MSNIRLKNGTTSLPSPKVGQPTFNQSQDSTFYIECNFTHLSFGAQGLTNTQDSNIFKSNGSYKRFSFLAA